ncbi:protein phosphatase [Sedimentibacter acidaminivorans]|uniref:Protein phosphatase n=1 Tax=Sedimentibacter acidaminivorans TaxID=913099 RepID=A0ABS4GB15_9FIRM|nr:Stp1/IreP family PP2C-type Ser/Thr phosphatase [Sedimentibacter acidaminivorans]MBP1924872.1 protein phosphatase [Sedimentibacter acidaminivorans]
MNVYFETNKGIIRDKNEDNLIIEETERYNLYAVADGMGGHKAGEIASSMLIDVIRSYFIKGIENDDFKIPTFIDQSIKAANIKILQEASNKDEYLGMGTTVTMAVIDLKDNIAYIGNVGDSRTYILRDNNIKQITEDHTYVRELVKEGKISREEAKIHPQKNIITRAIGSEENISIDIFEIELIENDILLLCSDGLTTHLLDDEIMNIIKTYGSSDSVKKLIKFCNDNGGTDNITVIIIDNSYRGDNL